MVGDELIYQKTLEEPCAIEKSLRKKEEKTGVKEECPYNIFKVYCFMCKYHSESP